VQVLGLNPLPKPASASLSFQLLFPSQPLFDIPDPLRMNLVQQGIVALDDVVLPLVPESVRGERQKWGAAEVSLGSVTSSTAPD